jgi:hypothetical protein
MTCDRFPTYRLGPDFDNRLDRFVDRFLKDGFEYFDPEFAQIERFLEQVAREPADRDAHKLRSTPKEMYLLEAVAFKIYDRRHREAFNKAADTVIIMPDCFSLHNPDCLKTDLKTGDECQQCTPDCSASHVVDLADSYGIKAVFSKRKLSDQIEYYAGKSTDLGVIGIGCILMLASGMRTAAEVDVPARGVLLDCSGCEHWNDEPFASPFQISRLEEILKEKYG